MPRHSLAVLRDDSIAREGEHATDIVTDHMAPCIIAFAGAMRDLWLDIPCNRFMRNQPDLRAFCDLITDACGDVFPDVSPSLLQAAIAEAWEGNGVREVRS